LSKQDNRAEAEKIIGNYISLSSKNPMGRKVNTYKPDSVLIERIQAQEQNKLSLSTNAHLVVKIAYLVACGE